MRRKGLLALLAGAPLALTLWAFVLEPASLSVNRYDLSLPRWPAEQDGLRVALLSDLHTIQRPPVAGPGARNIYWVYGVVLADSVPFDAAEAMRRLGALGIGTRPFFFPMHEQPVLRRMGLFDGVRHPVAERLARRGFYLPSGLGLTRDQIERSAAGLRDILEAGA